MADSTDVDLREDLAPRSPAGLGGEVATRDGEHAAWQQFAEARTAEAFCESWLDLQCRNIAGVSGGLVLVGGPGGGPFMQAASWPDGRRNVKQLVAAAERTFVERRGLVLKPQAQGPSSLPYPATFVVAYPIQVDGRVRGVVALEIGARPEPKLHAVLRQLQWGSAWLEVLFLRKEASKGGAITDRLQTALDLVATVVEHEGFYGAGMAFVTALATRLACDRVSVGFLRGGRVRVRAISHSAQFGKETNLIRTIESAMDEAVDQKAVIVHPAAPGAPARVVRAHGDLARLDSSGTICSIPLSGNGRILGAITLERPGDLPFDPWTIELLEAVAAVVGPLLEVKRRDDRWLIVKAADALTRELGHLIGPRHMARKLSLVALAAVVAFFMYAQGDYRVTARTVIEPSIQRAAVAPFDGYIARAEVRAGDRVREGDLIASLDDRDLRLERLRWLSQHEQFSRQHRQALAAGDAAQLRILSAQMEQARAQMALVDFQLARMKVVAPFDGVVVSGDLSQSIGRA